MKINQKEISIYIHIPFCTRKCLYCDFLSASAATPVRNAYIKALLNEIKKEAFRYSDYIVTTIFIGGGTPSILPAVQIKSILNQIQIFYHCASGMEISMECNPGSATYEKIKKWREAGINRLSIGLQSADNKELLELGRIHTYEQFLETYTQARNCGFTNINVDIMSALPGQSVESYRNTLTKVMELQPEHISAYSLIIEEGTPFFERYGNSKNIMKFCPLPNEEDERTMYYDTENLLKKAGYHRYEISNYAKKGYECRHNLTYWSLKDYVGFGCGAASYFEGERYRNIDSTEEYIKIMEDPLEKENCNALKTDRQILTDKDKQEEYMFVGLRLMKGVSIAQFTQQFGKSMEEVYGNVIQKLTEEKLLCKRGDYLRMTKRGIDISNYVMEQFLQDE